jgi:hypothetical protein
VRKWLQIAGKQPIFALIAAILVGAIIIIALYAIRGFLTNVLARWIYWGEFPGFKFVWSSFYSSVTSVNFTGKYLIPAVAVHAWILLFGLGAIIVKLLGYFAWSVDKTQWFLKRGRNHSLQAIGYVGGAIVFVSTVLYQAMARGI